MEQQTVEMITQMVLQTISRMEEKSNGYQVPVGVSARHIHLTQEHVETLFGEGYHLTKKKDLMGGQYACNETVTVVGLKLRAIENVRVLGPVRKASRYGCHETGRSRAHPGVRKRGRKRSGGSGRA